MRRPAFRPDRRGFLKQGAALGLAGAAPLLLTSCIDSGDDSVPAEDAATSRIQRREPRQLNFDLSSAAIANPRLVALRSRDHDAPLVAHDAASRAKHCVLNPVLANVDDARLTHYLEDADLPGGSLQSLMVMGTDPKTGEPVLGGVWIHVPQAALASVAQRAAQTGRPRTLSAKALAYGMPTPLALASVRGDGSNDFATPYDIATFLVFHHPEVMNLKPDLGAEIMSRIENAPCATDDPNCTAYSDSLVFNIAQILTAKGLPTTTPGSWATLVPSTDLDGKVSVDAQGKPIYHYDVADSIAADVNAVVKELLIDLYDDPLFKGTNWHETQSIASQSATAVVAGGVHTAVVEPRQTPLAAALDEAFQVEAAQPVGSWISGVHIVGLEVADASNRTVRMTVKNAYLRFLSVYVQYLDANGEAIAVGNPGDLDSTRAKYLRMVSTNDQIMGIPFFGDQIESTDIEFSMPPGASHAKVMFGSLGLGGDAFCPEAVAGSCLTLGLNIGIPTILLAAGVYGDLKEGWAGIFKDEASLKAILYFFKRGLAASGADVASGIYGSADSRSCVSFLSSLGNVAIQVILSAAPTLLANLALYIGPTQFSFAVPFLGWAIKLLSIGADLAAIVETVSEVLCSPAIDTNQVSLTMDTTVRIARDPRNAHFPLSATKYTLEATYDGGAKPFSVSGSVDAGRVDPIDVVLPGRPSGGTVVVKVSLYSDDQCLVGLKTTDKIINLPATAGTIPIEIREFVAPLKSTTTYRHALKLGYANGSRRWVAGTAPQLTRANLCAGADGAICDLNGITVHTATGMIGYGFFSGGQNVAQCGNNAGGTLNTIQNEFSGENPDNGYKFSSCGYTQPVGIVYDPLGPAAGGHHFFLQPANDGYHLRGTSLATRAPTFDLGQTKSWGRFQNALDSLAVLPSGFVVGINRVNHKMEVLLLPAEPVDGAVEPKAVPFAATKLGKGSRAGLLDTPVAVATWGGAVLILEQGNRRVQAFDAIGNSVSLFQGKSTPLMVLKPEADGVTATYLDLAVEGLGYLFVLSYVSNGSTPSDYRLDVYSPNGDFIARTGSVAAARIAVDLFRTVYTLNYEPVVGAPKVEPSVSQWLPVTPDTCPSDLPSVTGAAQGKPERSVAACRVAIGATA